MTGRDRAAYLLGMRTMASILSDHPVVPLPFGSLEIHTGGWMARKRPPADQIAAFLAVIAHMDGPEIELRFGRAGDRAQLVIEGRVQGLPVRVETPAGEVCEYRPEGRVRADRWVIPPELVDAVEGRNRIAHRDGER